MQFRLSLKLNDMIYIRTHYDQLCEDRSIVGVYQVPCKNAEEQYKLFMLEKAKEINLEINPHWLNALDYTRFNSHLSKTEYNKKVKDWNKIRRKWNMENYICRVLKGVKHRYKAKAGANAPKCDNIGCCW